MRRARCFTWLLGRSRDALAIFARQRIQKIVRVFLAGELLTFARNRHGSLVLEPLGGGLVCRPL